MHEAYLAQMRSNTKNIRKLVKVCRNFMKVSVVLLTSVKTNICLCTQPQVYCCANIECRRKKLILLFCNTFFRTNSLIMKTAVLTILASRPSPQMMIWNSAKACFQKLPSNQFSVCHKYEQLRSSQNHTEYLGL